MTLRDAFRAHLSSADGDIDLARRVLRGVLRLALRELGEDDDSAARGDTPGDRATGAAPAAEAPTISKQKEIHDGYELDSGNDEVLREEARTGVGRMGGGVEGAHAEGQGRTAGDARGGLGNGGRPDRSAAASRAGGSEDLIAVAGTVPALTEGAGKTGTIPEPRCDRLVDADGRCYDDDCPEHAGDGYDPIPAAAGAAPTPSVQPLAEGAGKSGDTFALGVERSLVGDAVPHCYRAPAAEGQRPALSRKRRLRIIGADGQEIG